MAHLGYYCQHVCSRMLGYSTGIAEQASTYGAALADEEFWRLGFVFSCVIASLALNPVSCLALGVLVDVSDWEFSYDLKSLLKM